MNPAKPAAPVKPEARGSVHLASPARLWARLRGWRRRPLEAEVSPKAAQYSAQVGPHGFRGLYRGQRPVVWKGHQLCEACYLPPYMHPLEVWVPARPYADYTVPAPLVPGWDKQAGVA